MSVFNYNKETKLQTYEVDIGTTIQAPPRTIVYWPDYKTEHWVIQGNTYPIRGELCIIPGSKWDSISKEWRIPYTEENRVKLEKIRLSQ